MAMAISQSQYLPNAILHIGCSTILYGFKGLNYAQKSVDIGMPALDYFLLPANHISVRAERQRQRIVDQLFDASTLDGAILEYIVKLSDIRYAELSIRDILPHPAGKVVVRHLPAADYRRRNERIANISDVQ